MEHIAEQIRDALREPETPSAFFLCWEKLLAKPASGSLIRLEVLLITFCKLLSSPPEKYCALSKHATTLSARLHTKSSHLPVTLIQYGEHGSHTGQRLSAWNAVVVSGGQLC